MAMFQPTYRDIINKVNSEGSEEIFKSRYSVVIATAKRARQIVDGAPVIDEPLDDKPLTQAVNEIYSGKIKVTKKENA